MADDDQIWEPAPVSETEFHGETGVANINRAPLDQVAGVTFKRSVLTKRVLYDLAGQVLDAPEPWLGRGSAVVRWLFSEQAGTAEGLLRGRSFAFLQEMALAPESATAQQTHAGVDIVMYVIQGRGDLYHRPTAGSPIVTRPLRPCDAALIRAGELYSVSNESASDELRLVVLGLKIAPGREEGDVDG